MTLKSLPHLFKPRDYQKPLFNAIFNEGYKHVLAIIHRRAGKSVCALNIIIIAACQKVGLYLYLLPESTQTKRVIWDAISLSGERFLDYIPREIISKINNTEMSIYLKNGSIIKFTGSNKFDGLIGCGANFIIHDEWAISDPRARELLAPLLLASKGIEVVISTPRGSNHLKDLYDIAVDSPNWFVSRLSVDDTRDADGNPIITKEQIDQEIAEGKDPNIIQQEYYVSFSTGNIGAYFTKEMEEIEKRNGITDFEIRKNYPVFVSFDLGMHDPTSVVLWQAYNGKMHFIYSFESNNKPMGYYSDMLIQVKKSLGFRKYQHYWAPHDVMVKESSSARTRLSLFREAGIHFQVVPRVSIPDKISSGRAFLKDCCFHKTNCKFLIRCLHEFQREFDPVTKVFRDKPKHDWTCHAADAFMYAAIAWRENFSKPENNAVRKYKREDGII